MKLVDQNIAVTGGAGFLGSFVVEALAQRGCQRVSAPRSAEYDLVQAKDVERFYDDLKPTLVIHLAARVGGIGANRANPGKFFYDNLMMGAQLMEQGRVRGLGKLVAAGTICAYPKFAPIPFREEDIWNGYPEETNAPYGLAKKMLLVQSQAYRQQYGFNSVVLFPVNLYGPRDNFHPETSHVIPSLIRKIDSAVRHNQDEVVLWGDGTPTREFLYVSDAAEAIVRACESYDSSEPMNIGSGSEISIQLLAETIGNLMGYKGRFRFDTSQPNGQPRRSLDVSRAKERLGWSAKTAFDEGLKRTIAWWRDVR